MSRNAGGSGALARKSAIIVFTGARSLVCKHSSYVSVTTFISITDTQHTYTARMHNMQLQDFPCIRDYLNGEVIHLLVSNSITSYELPHRHSVMLIIHATLSVSCGELSQCNSSRAKFHNCITRFPRLFQGFQGQISFPEILPSP